MIYPKVELTLPDWMESALPDPAHRYGDSQERMALVIDLARRNVDAGTGGPFGAAVFEMETGKLVAPGVNRVMPANCSAAHAEVVAIAIAQQVVGSFDLGAAGLPAMELVSSTEPCAMCLGAVIWSGVRRLVCGAREADAERIGFDEGPKPDNWEAALQKRGIQVVHDVKRQEAAAVLQHYVDSGGQVYNARQATQA